MRGYECNVRKRLEQLLHIIEDMTRICPLEGNGDQLEGFQIAALSERTGILPNNVSGDLNELFLGGHLLKIKGRPVHYLSLPVLEERLGRSIPSGHVEGMEAFWALVRPGPIRPPAREGGLNAAAPSSLDGLIGAAGSLRLPIRQAKAAILYPPSGLHTLITGQTGVGKSSFARNMYDYAVKSGRLAADAAFVTLNCANYADNPQLLLSQLFGHVRGAFTGADKDHAGLVERAHNGILFFDEIHRLSPQGQEKLFLLMDQGTYNRLGETGQERRAKVLILGATTEDPQVAMLSTFMRRIPVHITLPSLRERSLRERLELVLYCLWREARSLKLRFSAEREVIYAFCYYACGANIGQLFTDITLTCANAYYDFLLNGRRDMVLQISHLDENVRQGLFTSSNSRNELLCSLFLEKEGALTFDGGVAYDHMLDRYLVPVREGRRPDT